MSGGMTRCGPCCYSNTSCMSEGNAVITLKQRNKSASRPHAVHARFVMLATPGLHLFILAFNKGNLCNYLLSL